MEAVHRTALRRYRCDIIDMLLNDTSKLHSILDNLCVDCHIPTDSMLEEIQSERTYRSRIRRLLNIIPKIGPHAYYLFLHCLEEHGFDTLRTLIIANENTIGHYQQQREYMPFYNLSQQKQNVDAQINDLNRTKVVTRYIAIELKLMDNAPSVANNCHNIIFQRNDHQMHTDPWIPLLERWECCGSSLIGRKSCFLFIFIFQRPAIYPNPFLQMGIYLWK